ncbi:DNA gyrase subunit A [Alienimonas californiensis]|uniref:DNA topoisomerase (ATP-hydrolyzing) n=1 Tax=Alienimonas californiensis TaxID=2527989 RepID=A0A517PD42_9PLAN|nr:DNA gyrase subunit A [Alienimonas californiensis]QDT17241.1 DNA gyrase subunit A [Alienimonas californiensis]
MADETPESSQDALTGDEIVEPRPDPAAGGNVGKVRPLDIQDEMRTSYLTYAMSVIVSRALPDVRDGLKPSQRRILVAMRDLNLSPGGSTTKCAGIVGETMKRYHPHGDGAIYPTLARMAQPWVMRGELIAKQGNFGSLAGLPPAQMRYTEAKLAPLATEMLRDLDKDTVDFADNYDGKYEEPTVLPSRYPNLLVNGSTGIAVGMATSIPPHNLGEVCRAVAALIDDPDLAAEALMEYVPGPDFPTGGVICGRMGILQGYKTGRSTLTLRARTKFETKGRQETIVVTEIPYMETRDRIREKLEQVAKEGRVEGISRVTDYTDRKTPPWRAEIHIDLKRDADRDVVLNQLFKYSPLQTTVSVILLALVGQRPRTLGLREILLEFVRHRVDVTRRRTEYQLAADKARKHTVEGLLVAQVDIDEIIRTIRASPSREEARNRLQEIQVASELIERALGDGFDLFQEEKGVAETYSLSRKQADAIVSMQLGSLANLEREQLGGEYAELIQNIREYLRLLSDEANLRAVVRADMVELAEKFGDERRTEIDPNELGNVDIGDLIAEEPMVVTISARGYVKRTPLSVYQAQNRGGKGIKGAKTDEEDPVEHLFVSSTHDWLLFFTDKGKVYWRKVYDLPFGSRIAKGRALVNLLQLSDAGEQVANCLAVGQFPDDQYLIMATRNGTVKKTALSAYGRPLRGGIIAINLDEGDELIDVRIVGGKGATADDVVLATKTGMSIRFSHEDARPMGRATRGVRGINLSKDDEVVGLVVAEPDLRLLTLSEKGLGKRTPFGLGELPDADDVDEPDADDVTAEAVDDAEDAPATSGNARYRRQKRGGKGLRDLRVTEKTGPVMAVAAVADDDEVLMMTSAGKIQRIRARDIRETGRNAQGVRCIRLDAGDTLASVARIPADLVEPELADAEAAAEEGGVVEPALEQPVGEPIPVPPEFPTDDGKPGA